MSKLTQLIKQTPLYQPLNSLRYDLTRWKWRRLGCPVPPPPEVKHATIKDYARRFGISVLVETGTYWGGTIAATRNQFAEIYSIELSPELHKCAEERFRDDPKVHLLLGDSGIALREILLTMNRTALFWLDAHYSGGSTARGAIDTPILQELNTILTLRPNSVVLIDDARCFDGSNSYPTLAELRQHVRDKAPHLIFTVKHDIIRLHQRLVQS
jgi:hypothetical protein